MDFKDILRTRRSALNLTLDDVGRHVGVSGATVSRWENGEIENIRRDKIAKLAEVLQVSPAYLMGWEEENQKFVTPQLDDVYLRFAKQAQDEGISPSDIQLAIETIKKLRGE